MTKRTFYCTLGEFCAEGMGRGYTGHGCYFVKTTASSMDEAVNKFIAYGESLFGKQEKKDMWYGEIHYNWNYELTTEILWNRQQRAIYNSLIYSNQRAKKMFEGTDKLTIDEVNKIDSLYKEKYKVVTIE